MKIKPEKVRLIGTDGRQLGIFNFEEAQKIAERENLDLILVNEKQNPLVVRLGNYGQYLYQREKKEREISKKQKEVKEIRIGFNEALFDLKRKSKLIKEFLEEGHQVQIRLNLKGRERLFEDLAEQKLNNFLNLVGELIKFKITQPLKKYSSFYTLMISKA